MSKVLNAKNERFYTPRNYLFISIVAEDISQGLDFFRFLNFDFSFIPKKSKGQNIGQFSENLIFVSLD